MVPESAGKDAVEVEIRHRLGTLTLAASFRATAPWTVLFGPSGSGKSTILRGIAGLVRPDRGRISVLGQVVVDRAEGVWVEAHRRPVRWAGQRAALFPQKTVRRNLAAGFGVSKERVPGPAAVDGALQLFGLQTLSDKRPGELSGGERQRVSVVRAAMGARGRVLLLDEPFAGLDAAVRDELIQSLRAWLGETPVISVTHDVGEAFLLGAEVVRIADGKVVAQGGVETVLEEERARLNNLLG